MWRIATWTMFTPGTVDPAMRRYRAFHRALRPAPFARALRTAPFARLLRATPFIHVLRATPFVHALRPALLARALPRSRAAAKTGRRPAHEASKRDGSRDARATACTVAAWRADTRRADAAASTRTVHMRRLALPQRGGAPRPRAAPARASNDCPAVRASLSLWCPHLRPCVFMPIATQSSRR